MTYISMNELCDPPWPTIFEYKASHMPMEKQVPLLGTTSQWYPFEN